MNLLYYKNTKNKTKVVSSFNVNTPIKKISKPNINEKYNYLVDKFINIYNINKKDLKDPKIEFKYWCFRYIQKIKLIELPSISLNLNYEAVLVDFRIIPHVEFIIRNNILKLGSDWSFTVICGNLNYDFMINLCNSISNNIKVIKLNYDNLTTSEYSTLLASLDFWNLLIGEKIIIYQDDSIIFKNNVNDFIMWDYIGAPFYKQNKVTPNGVGNGGFSLRTKQCMIEIINKFYINDTIMSPTVIKWMKTTNSTVNPEDVYFSQNMQEYNIGVVANWDSAFKFSTESIYNPDSFAGHGFWIGDINWKKRLEKLINI
jgi:hypothetical protein